MSPPCSHGHRAWYRPFSGVPEMMELQQSGDTFFQCELRAAAPGKHTTSTPQPTTYLLRCSWLLPPPASQDSICSQQQVSCWALPVPNINKQRKPTRAGRTVRERTGGHPHKGRHVQDASAQNESSMNEPTPSRPMCGWPFSTPFLITHNSLLFQMH